MWSSPTKRTFRNRLLCLARLWQALFISYHQLLTLLWKQDCRNETALHNNVKCYLQREQAGTWRKTVFFLNVELECIVPENCCRFLEGVGGHVCWVDLETPHRKMEYLRRGEGTFLHLKLPENSRRKTELDLHCCPGLRQSKHPHCNFLWKPLPLPASNYPTGRNCSDWILASECPNALIWGKGPVLRENIPSVLGVGSCIGKILKKRDCQWVSSKVDAWLELGVQRFGQSDTCGRKRKKAGLSRSC